MTELEIPKRIYSLGDPTRAFDFTTEHVRSILRGEVVEDFTFPVHTYTQVIIESERDLFDLSVSESIYLFHKGLRELKPADGKRWHYIFHPTVCVFGTNTRPSLDSRNRVMIFRNALGKMFSGDSVYDVRCDSPETLHYHTMLHALTRTLMITTHHFASTGERLPAHKVRYYIKFRSLLRPSASKVIDGHRHTLTQFYHPLYDTRSLLHMNGFTMEPGDNGFYRLANLC